MILFLMVIEYNDCKLSKVFSCRREVVGKNKSNQVSELDYKKCQRKMLFHSKSSEQPSYSAKSHQYYKTTEEH